MSFSKSRNCRANSRLSKLSSSHILPARSHAARTIRRHVCAPSCTRPVERRRSMYARPTMFVSAPMRVPTHTLLTKFATSARLGSAKDVRVLAPSGCCASSKIVSAPSGARHASAPFHSSDAPRAAASVSPAPGSTFPSCTGDRSGSKVTGWPCDAATDASRAIRVPAASAGDCALICSGTGLSARTSSRSVPARATSAPLAPASCSGCTDSSESAAPFASLASLSLLKRSTSSASAPEPTPPRAASRWRRCAGSGLGGRPAASICASWLVRAVCASLESLASASSSLSKESE
mmetsp:Transcript_11483/g.29879  ORF Transcript_11483/g.29879 Transcript_11483/m.29879 type:complete len:293 (-) Transcript_11483:1513-2391(-)